MEPIITFEGYNMDSQTARDLLNEYYRNQDIKTITSKNMNELISEYEWKKQRVIDLKIAINTFGSYAIIDSWKDELKSLEVWLNNNVPILFITNDGKKLTDKKDEVWIIDKKTLKRIIGNGYNIGTLINGWYCSSETYGAVNNDTERKLRILAEIKERFEVFSSAEKAEEYIINNKPCISLQQIRNSMDNNMGTVYTRHGHVLNELKNLVKDILTAEDDKSI